MTLFEEILVESSLLLEDVSVDNITKAINGLHPVWITYNDGKGGGGKNRRLIYPVAYGKTTAGNPVIRAFQPQGSSKRGLTTPPNDREYPKWKFFRTDRIKFWRTVNSRTFDESELVGFNEDGDKSMSIVYAIAPIGNGKKIKRNEPKPEEESATTQTPQSAQTTQTPQNSFEPRPITKDEVENIDITPAEQPSKKKYTAKNAIDSIINFIKKFGKKNNKNLENQPENNNINVNGSINAPDTKPVTKQEIGTQPGDTVETQAQEPPANDKPVLKTDITPEEENEENKTENDLKECVLSKSFNDMMNRMNNLY